MRIAELASRSVAIWGLGREGRAAHSVLRKRFPDKQLTIFCRETEAQATSVDCPFDRFISSEPSAGELAGFDVVIKSPGISAYRPELIEAQREGTRFTSTTALWFSENPDARVIAVTGTKGKSTTSALIAHLLRSLGRRTALAGNIGMPLLELLDPVDEPDWWVIELSSFQTREADQLDLAVVTNIEEEHLDWHGSRERYVEDKLALAAVARRLLVNAAQAELLERTTAHGRRLSYGLADGWHVDGESIRRGERIVLDRSRLPLPGWHNALNAAAALAALEAIGEDAITAAEHLASFRPLPHRLQTLGVRDALNWIDDSIATTPRAVIEALRSHGGGDICLIIGGHDRGLDWQAFVAHVRAHPPRAIISNGASGHRIEALLRANQGDYQLQRVETLSEAVAVARELTAPGGTILLSPGAPSFDQFRDYAERGRRFAELAGFDADMIGQIEGLGIA
ncbi:MAG TPA: UDP-N-acetylmuramoyl-L-alanine--D-glutamate ligase [Dokdonella sp.]|uniref:UDP-N-acetylmuramoyl-L-alanine--D-glutamate ligase n=1 Tax=Dokdonella sp. TaxID=2291710 RepID=UPI002D7FEB6D|nr:UDP-N-acetylmuramoyl-L-alanine--D-glutamate ligase [Dokdonella sp.]HET9033069.1 UDP-N-acetylmuramoyl-L-alanine--D-glutamate ligase [Dokdonella sp.]